jgi:hypothetical protein
MSSTSNAAAISSGWPTQFVSHDRAVGCVVVGLAVSSIEHPAPKLQASAAANVRQAAIGRHVRRNACCCEPEFMETVATRTIRHGAPNSGALQSWESNELWELREGNSGPIRTRQGVSRSKLAPKTQPDS